MIIKKKFGEGGGRCRLEQHRSVRENTAKAADGHARFSGAAQIQLVDVCVWGGGVGGFFSSSLGVSAPPDRVRSGTITMRRELASLNVKHRGVCGSARVSSCIKIQVLPRHWC